MPRIHPFSVVETDDVPDDVTIGPFTFVGEGVRLGSGVTLHPNVTIAPGSMIGAGTTVFPGTYIGKPPMGAGAIVRTPVPRGRARIGERCAVGPNAIIYEDVEIGDDTLVGDGASIREQVRIGARCLISRYVVLNFDVTIGDDTRVTDFTGLTGPNCRVGNGVFISAGVLCANDQLMGRAGFGDHTRGPQIEDGAFVGLGARLLPGVHIGKDAVVGVAAVVNRDVAAGTTVLGIPARRVPR